MRSDPIMNDSLFFCSKNAASAKRRIFVFWEAKAMNRSDMEAYIARQYGVLPEYPWVSSPESAVFRHTGNRKWFAVIMEIPRGKLGLSGEDMLQVINFKHDAAAIAALWAQPGCYPAYHMNKNHWVTVALDGTADNELLLYLLERSFCLTGCAAKR